MSNEEELKAQVDNLKKEVDELRKKLKDRNPAFVSHLGKRAEKLSYDLKTNIAQAVFQAAGDASRVIEGKTFRVYKQYSSYMGTTYHFSFDDKKKDEELLSYFEDKELVGFTESLNNFAWAVNNQG